MFCSLNSSFRKSMSASVNLNPAISDSEGYSAISAQVSEVQRDQSVIPSATAYHSWFAKLKRDKLTEYFKFHPHQPKTIKFNAINVYFQPDDSKGRLHRLSFLYCEEKNLYFAIFSLHIRGVSRKFKGEGRNLKPKPLKLFWWNKLFRLYQLMQGFQPVRFATFHHLIL